MLLHLACSQNDRDAAVYVGDRKFSVAPLPQTRDPNGSIECPLCKEAMTLSVRSWWTALLFDLTLLVFASAASVLLYLVFATWASGSLESGQSVIQKAFGYTNQMSATLAGTIALVTVLLLFLAAALAIIQAGNVLWFHPYASRVSFGVGRVDNGRHVILGPNRDYCPKWQPARWLFGFDLDGDDPRNLQMSAVPFNEAKEAYGPFGALATFALAQGAALTAVAKDENHQLIVLLIYLAAVLFTVAWMSALLRHKRYTKVRPGNLSKGTRAYDRPSILFGRWALAWTIALGAVMALLAHMELLPNQTSRVTYDAGPIELTPLNAQQAVASPTDEEFIGKKWIEWISTRRRNQREEQFVFLEQKIPFEDNYRPFSMRLTCDSRYVFSERVAFLKRTSTHSGRPIYNQVYFAKADISETNEAVLNIADAQKNDKLIILVFARNPGNKKQPAITGFGFELVR